MTYGDQLTHPSWQRKRLSILERDNFICQFCNDTETQLHIHHKEYINGKKVWEYPDELLITVCKNCHDVIEFCKKQDIFIKKCQWLLYKDGRKAQLLCVAQDDICLIWEYNKDGEVNGKTLVVSLPFRAFETIFNFFKDNK